MTQPWGPPPNYPPPRPPRRPRYLPPPPEYDYYYNDDDDSDTIAKRAMFFAGGSCLTLVIVGVCFCALAFLWVVDAQLGITAANQTASNNQIQPVVVNPPVQNPAVVQVPQTAQQVAPGQQSAPVAVPTPHVPATIGQPVLANDVGVELTIWDIQRNVQPINFDAAEGLEFVAVSVQLRDLGTVPGSKPYEVTSFQLQDLEGNFFPPHLEADNGRRLANGELGEGAIIEGDVLFHVPLGQAPLTLVWQPLNSADFYSVTLQ